MPSAELLHDESRIAIPIAENEIENLPDDVTMCHGLIRELLFNLKKALSLNEKQKHQLELLLKARYGSRSEKFDPNQIPLFVAEELARIGLAKKPEPPAETRTITYKRRVGTHGRKPLPEHLLRTRVEHAASDSEKKCSACGKEKIRIGEDVSEQLEYVPASLYVIQHVCGRYACSCGAGGVTTAQKPMQPIEKGLPGPGLLAHVAVSKYADHLPLNRLEGIFERHGVEIARSTMCSWMASSAQLAKPVYDLMKERILKSKKIHTDDTTVRVLDPLLPKTRTGRMWDYLGDDENPYNVFDFSANRKSDHPERFLRDYKGYLQADAYRGYDAIYAGRNVIEVACWAHARRKYVEAESTDPTNSAIALTWIRRLYEVEEAARGHPPPERAQMRGERSKPVIEEFRKWLDATARAVLPKSPMGQAIAYTLANWVALKRYLDDGILDIDNNAAERALRAIAVGRKNWMFAGSDNGGRTAAVLFSLTSTCKRLDVEPFAYLRDLFARISAHPAKKVHDFLPDVWKKLRAADSTTPAV